MLAYFWAGESCLVIFVSLWPPCTMFNIGILWWAGIEERGKKKTGEGGGGEEFSQPSCPLWLSSTLPRFSQYGGYTSRKIRALKENAWECKFWFVLVLSVQPQLPSTGESSYSINMSGGHASIGDHSVTNVGTATPRWRIPNIINWAASSRRQPSS